MTESILNTIKQMLGILPTDTSFDEDIKVHINSALMVLNQIGVGTEAVFAVEDENDVWTDFLIDPDAYSSTKSFIYLSVKILFDPPSSSYVLDSLSKQRDELVWRLNTQLPIPPET